MKIRILLANSVIAAIATQAHAYVPACIAADIKSAECKITYTTADGYDEERNFEVARVIFTQNSAPGAGTCSLLAHGTFEAYLDGDAQQDFNLFADGFKGQIIEDQAAGTFLVPKLSYGSNIPPEYQVVEDFPPITVSFLQNSKQQISFVTRHERVEALMKCTASKDPSN